MIKPFKNRETENIFNGIAIKGFPTDVLKRAVMKLHMLNASLLVTDLRVPPSNHLETLQGNRKGQYSIRINDKYRICFEWIDNNAFNVEIIDYH